MTSYHPDFDEECRLCGTSPCVVVENHPAPNTELCGRHFFNTAEAINWEEWNDIPEDNE